MIRMPRAKRTDNWTSYSRSLIIVNISRLYISTPRQLEKEPLICLSVLHPRSLSPLKSPPNVSQRYLGGIYNSLPSYCFQREPVHCRLHFATDKYMTSLFLWLNLLVSQTDVNISQPSFWLVSSAWVSPYSTDIEVCMVYWLLSDRSFANITLLGLPASLTFGYAALVSFGAPVRIWLTQQSFGAVFMICAVGVYV